MIYLFDTAWISITTFLMIMLSNRVYEVTVNIGAIYYIEAILCGYFVCLVIYTFRMKKGYSIKIDDMFLFVMTLVLGTIGLPMSILLFFPKETWDGISHLGTLVTIGSFLIISICGFSGKKDKFKFKSKIKN